VALVALALDCVNTGRDSSALWYANATSVLALALLALALVAVALVPALALALE
jgi:hypothetical protein